MIPNYETVKFDMLCCVDLPQLNGTSKRIYLNVEIQNNIHPGYSLVTRGIAYVLRILTTQWGVEYDDKNYDRMKKSIVISITKGRLFPSLEDCHNIFEVRDRKRGLLLCDRLELHFLELCKIDDQKPVHALTEIERLGAYLKFANIENRQDYVKQIIPSVDKGTHGLQRPICFCTLLSSLTVAPLRLAHSPRAEANIFSANFLGTWRLEISAQARPQDESLLDVSLRRERSMR